MTIPLSRPYIDEREVEAAARVVRSGWLSQGKEVAALEEEFARYLDPENPPYVVAVSSGTTALELCMRMAGAGPRMPVVCPSYTFVASANAGLYCKAPVELAEIQKHTYNIDPLTLPLTVDYRDPHVILAVHQVGLPCDVDGLLRASPGAVIVEDGACAIGARYPDGRRVGSRGDTYATCFSLHGSKSIVAGEGGLIATRSQDSAELFRMLRQHGVNVAAESRKNAEAEQYVCLGYNYRMTDIQAAIARVQIQKADEIVAERTARAKIYDEALSDLCVTPGSFEFWAPGHAYQRYLIRVGDNETRERVIDHLTRHEISCRRGLQVIHRQPYWSGQISLPVTENVADTTIQIPLWPTMTEQEQNWVIAVLEGALA